MKKIYITITILVGILAGFFIFKYNKISDKKQMRKERMEMIDSLKLEHPDSIVKYREKMWSKRKAKIDAKFDSLQAVKIK
tara:strand:- start:2512 stop:2751 length:240 start_codon:yes stop_codon:yes gene_type:complete